MFYDHYAHQASLVIKRAEWQIHTQHCLHLVCTMFNWLHAHNPFCILSSHPLHHLLSTILKPECLLITSITPTAEVSQKLWFLPASYRTLSPQRPNLELGLITARLSQVPSKHASSLLVSCYKPPSSLSWLLQTHPDWSPHRHSLSLPAHSLHSSKSNHCKISICTTWHSGWKHVNGFLISSEHLLDLSQRSSHHRPLCHLLSSHTESPWVPWT